MKERNPRERRAATGDRVKPAEVPAQPTNPLDAFEKHASQKDRPGKLDLGASDRDSTTADKLEQKPNNSNNKPPRPRPNNSHNTRT